MTKIANPLPRIVEPYGVGRRACVDQFTPAEAAIYNAVQLVEALGADPLLTDAVVKLTEARERVADWLEGGTRE